jgi:hypothetical protein
MNTLFSLVGRAGFEPATNGLKARYALSARAGFTVRPLCMASGYAPFSHPLWRNLPTSTRPFSAGEARSDDGPSPAYPPCCPSASRRISAPDCNKKACRICGRSVNLWELGRSSVQTRTEGRGLVCRRLPTRHSPFRALRPSKASIHRPQPTRQPSPKSDMRQSKTEPGFQATWGTTVRTVHSLCGSWLASLLSLGAWRSANPACTSCNVTSTRPTPPCWRKRRPHPASFHTCGMSWFGSCCQLYNDTGVPASGLRHL